MEHDPKDVFTFYDKVATAISLNIFEICDELVKKQKTGEFPKDGKMMEIVEQFDLNVEHPVSISCIENMIKDIAVKTLGAMKQYKL